MNNVVRLAIVVAAAAFTAGSTGSAQPAYSAEDNQYMGRMAVLGEMYSDALGDFAELTSNATGAEWFDPSWQRDMAGEAATLDALREATDAIVPPPRFADSHAEFVEAAHDFDRAGELIRLGIDTGDIDIFAEGTPLLNEGTAHMKRATDLLGEVMPD